MARIICDFIHFGGVVNGIAFTQDRGQWLSPELTDEQATYLASVPGYRLVAAPKGKAKPGTEPPALSEPPAAPPEK